MQHQYSEASLISASENIRRMKVGRATWVVNHVEAFDLNGKRNTAIELSVSSPWGNGTALFPRCGDCDWRDWLASMDAQYMYMKLFGIGTRTPNFDKTRSTIRGWINELRAEDAISVPDANRLRQSLREDFEPNPAIHRDDQIEGLVWMVRRHDLLANFGNPVTHQVSSRFRGFCRNAWEPFAEVMRAQYERFCLAQQAEAEPAAVAADDRDDDLEMTP